MRLIKKGATSQSLYMVILDSASTTGGRKTGIAFNTASLVANYVRNGAARTAITLATLASASAAWSSGGFVEVDATNAPGLYRLDVPDAAFASGADSVVVTLKGASGMVGVEEEVQLTAIDMQDAVRMAMTALPNAAAEAAGGLYTRGSGAGQINQNNNGQIDVNAARINAVATTSVTTINANVGTTQPTNFTGTAASALVKSDAIDLAGTALTGRDIGASVLLSSGTGTGQLDFTAGVVKANLAQILGTALTETAGQIAAAFKKWFDVASPVGTVNSIPNATAGAAGGLFIAGSNAATTVNFTGNVSGSVGSVSGAVGSVTGNVGGNVTGSVGSVATGGIAAASFASGAINRAALAADTGHQAIRSSTAQAGAAGTITLDASASATDNFYNDTIVYLTGGTGVGQVRRIRAYVGATKVATVVPNWTTNPDNTSTFAVLPVTSAWDETLADHLDTGSTGTALNAAGSAGDPWTTALPGAYGAGTAGKIVGDNLTGNAYTRLGAPVGASISADIAGVQSDTDNIQTRLPAALVSGRMDSSVGAMAAGVVTAAAVATNAIDADALAADAVTEIAAGVAVGSAPSAADNAAAVWNAVASSFNTAGTMGQKLNAAGGAADPLLNAVPGTYATGTAGYALGTLPWGIDSVRWSYTVTRSDNAAPIPGVTVYLTSDAAGNSVVYGPQITDNTGTVQFLVNPGTYYVWRQLVGYTFVNPDQEVVA